MIDSELFEKIVFLTGVWSANGPGSEPALNELRELLANEAADYRALAPWSELTQTIDAARQELERLEREHLSGRVPIDRYPTFALMAACPMRGALVVEDGWGACEGCHATVIDDEGNLSEHEDVELPAAGSPA